MNDYVIFFLSYCIGSIPTGLILGKGSFNVDIRERGSKNIGATNAWRIGGKKMGAITLILDILKGSIATLMAKHFLDDFHIWAGCLAVIGHIFPLWLKFKGGKGVATFIGVILTLNTVVGILTIALWICIFKISKISSISSLISLALASLYLATVNYDNHNMIFILCILAIVFFRHQKNLVRLWQGKEKIL